jgi:hypothetical protein
MVEIRFLGPVNAPAIVHRSGLPIEIEGVKRLHAGL